MNAEISFLQQKRVYSTFDIPQLLGSISRADGATFNIQITKEFVGDKVEPILTQEIVEIYKELSKDKKNGLEFSHGDFAPWNLKRNGDKYTLFDWEHCGYRMPGFDLMHYATIVQKVLNGKELSEAFDEGLKNIHQCLPYFAIEKEERRSVEESKEMNCTEVFNYIFESFNSNNIDYAIIHSYQYLPDRFDSDIDTAINVPNIKDAIKLLDDTLVGTGWRVIQFWRHENYAADCIISNDDEFLQVDFCTHYERNGRVVIPVQELLDGKRMYKNFYIPKPQTEFTYVLVKKILKKVFSDGSKQRLTALWKAMNFQCCG